MFGHDFGAVVKYLELVPCGQVVVVYPILDVSEDMLFLTALSPL